jgi:hypothetical protein
MALLHAARALACALQDDPEMLAAEVAWLDDGHLRQLTEAAGRLQAAAQAELAGRAVPS